MDVRMYETLHSIPLLQGMNGIDLNKLLGGMKLAIKGLLPGEELIRQGDRCDEMVILLRGKVETLCVSPAGTYSIRGELSGPLVLEPEVLYGIQRDWGCSYTAKDECNVVRIAKADVGKMLRTLEIFRINYLNLVCSLASKRRLAAWATPQPRLRGRFILFLHARTPQRRGRLEMNIRMKDLGEDLGVTRALVSDLLHEMQDDGMLVVKRGNIVIPEMAKLH